MPHEASTVARTTFEYVSQNGRTSPIDTELTYTSADPHAVTITFRWQDREVTWLMGRDLLARGLNFASGHGDVRVRPRRGGGVLELCAGARVSVFHFPARVVRRFLDATYELVPSGHEFERIDFEAGLRELLARP